MKKLFAALVICTFLTACGGGSDVVSSKNRGVYVMTSHLEALENIRFQRSFERESTCNLFKSESALFEFELNGMNILANGEITALLGIENQVLDPGTEVLLATIQSDGTFNFSDTVLELSEIPAGVPLEANFFSVGGETRLTIKPRGFELSEEIGFELFPTFTKIDRSDFEFQNDQLTRFCR